jgi:hypothetical protein
MREIMGELDLPRKASGGEEGERPLEIRSAEELVGFFQGALIYETVWDSPVFDMETGALVRAVKAFERHIRGGARRGGIATDGVAPAPNGKDLEATE